jgi:hypothetical protein
MLMILHHIALYAPCITLFDCSHLLHIRVDHAEPKTENQAEQVQWCSEVHKYQVVGMLKVP